jgi:secreted PhoX family phosphatase
VTISGNWDQRRVTRRDALLTGGAAAAALALGRGAAAANDEGPYGPLVADPGGLLDLPRGFQYRVISTRGEPMSDGRPTPGDPDGMAAFDGPGNTMVLIRNHELGFADAHIQGVVGTNPYNPAERGGTTALIVSPDRRVVRDYVTSSGTANNCAGGRTPWGTWITCEEDRDPPHGFVFEVMWDEPENSLSKTPITEMGFFSHEALGIDPATGFVYLTEDDFRGGDVVPGSDSRVSYLYRFRPNRTGFPGALLQGGTLEALAIESLVTPAQRTADFWTTGQTFGVVWKQVNPADPPASAEAQGCIRFNRLEGAYFAGGAFWFDDTVGGESRLGQIFRYLPATNTLELFLEGTSATVMEAPDNVVITPWGDLWFAEDGPGFNRVIGLRPDRTTYEFARVVGSEFAGPTFAPNGQTFFVNAQDLGLTFAIWGPFARQNRAGARMMAAAQPPAHYAPRISGELAEAAERYGLTPLEAAAFDRLGVPLT